MNKKHYILPAAKKLIIGLLTISGVLLLILFSSLFSGALPGLSWSIGLALCVLVLGVAAVRLIWIPERRLKQSEEWFMNDQMYDHMFTLDTYLSPEEDKVIQHFHNLLNKQNVLELSKKQAEYLALQNQINPHFLYNTLEAIRGDALCLGAKGIAETTEALATFFRYTITEMKDLVTVEDELENVYNYFTIQQYRFGEKMRMEIVMGDTTEAYHCQIPKLTLQPIVENAIYHGIENKAQGGHIRITVETTEKRLLISVKDDGRGIPADEVGLINQKLGKVAVSFINDGKKQRGGIALRNVAQRIKLLFGEEYGLYLLSTEGLGTEVHITLPKMIMNQSEVVPHENGTSAH